MARRLAIGSLFLTLAAIGVAVLHGAAADGDWTRGLHRLAVQRALARAAPLALAGLAGAILAVALAAALRALRWEGPLAGALLLAAAAAPLAVALVRSGARPALSDPRALAALLGAALLAWGAAYRRGARAEPVGAPALGLALGCALASLPVAAAAWTWLRAPELAGRPSVLLVVMDTVRADRLSAYGYERPTTPEIERFAREAIRYTRFYSTSSWTLPGHASLFTGLHPAEHGATQEHLRLERGAATLAEILRDAGYATFGASANPVVGPISGLDQGFREFREVWRAPPDAGSPVAHPVNAAFAGFLERATRDAPYFAFLNYMEAHRPYRPPTALVQRVTGRRVNPLVASRVGGEKWYEHYLGDPYTERELALLSDLYDAELARLSAALGELFALLRRAGRYDEALIAITSDHGESLGEHGLVDHVFGLYEPTIRVPLLLRLPGGERGGAVDPRLGQLPDLFATLLVRCGIGRELAPGAGVDLLGPEPARERVVAEYYWPEQALGMIDAEERRRHAEALAPFERRLRAIREDGRKLVWSSDGRHELYDLIADPGETENRIDDVEIGPLLTALERTVGPLPADPVPAPAGDALAGDADRTAREALRALGYVE